MEHNDRKGRDAAGIGPYARERETLTPLSSLDSWVVSDGEPDIRGWEVRTVSGRQLGAVADLLVDADAREVVLIDVDLPGSDRHTFVPIRVVEIDRARRVVLMDSADLPESDLERSGGKITRAMRDADDVAVVRYPRADREVVLERPALADEAGSGDTVVGRDAVTGEPIVERRRGDRRRIDRMSTDL